MYCLAVHVVYLSFWLAHLWHYFLFLLFCRRHCVKKSNNNNNSNNWNITYPAQMWQLVSFKIGMRFVYSPFVLLCFLLFSSFFLFCLKLNFCLPCFSPNKIFYFLFYFYFYFYLYLFFLCFHYLPRSCSAQCHTSIVPTQRI